MEISIQNLIEAEERLKITIKKRYQNIRRALNRYKCGKSRHEERKILVDAMQSYKGLAFKEQQARAYNVLLYYYFSSRPLIPEQIMRLFNIDRRTVFKGIDRGVRDLAVLLHGIDGLDWRTKEDRIMEEKMKEQIIERLTEELEQEVRNECRAFFVQEHSLMNTTCESRTALKECLQASIKKQPTEEFVQDIIEPKDHSDFAIKVRQQQVREALRRYKKGNSTPGEREELIQAMERYRTTAINEKQDKAYNILFCFYFADYPLKTAQISDRFRIGKRTVFKYITRGVEDLTDIMYGTGGICLNPDDVRKAALSNTQTAN
jgi:hypothetical protein